MSLRNLAGTAFLLAAVGAPAMFASSAFSSEGTIVTSQPAVQLVPRKTLPIPEGFEQVSATDVRVDGEAARLVRSERTNGRNGGLEGEHVSMLVTPAGRLKGFVRMDGSLRNLALPSREDTRAIAMAFLSDHAPDLLQALAISFIEPHDEVVLLDGQREALTGMKVKMRNLSDGRWFWVIIGGDRQAMVFERDIVWANLKGRRQTEKWLHDSWLKDRRARNRP
ncbi:hypothetical protein [Bosea lathyri]|uniref:Uncharacterized protein n=1 Tax=Bosea lathyri TaxID=1036778 RepID=A0A1H5SRI3_9HYPH|nr:hypothetical protein [Bosea lathyri]SEF52377.1 hypothetical protein SAMN04488115_101361 [Bosea lathyri]